MLTTIIIKKIKYKIFFWVSIHNEETDAAAFPFPCAAVGLPARSNRGNDDSSPLFSKPCAHTISLSNACNLGTVSWNWLASMVRFNSDACECKKNKQTKKIHDYIQYFTKYIRIVL